MTGMEVVMTDGTNQKRIIWIRTSPYGIYCSFFMGDSDNHVSYHKDGSVWRTFNGPPRKVAQFEPLNSFKDIHNMIVIGFSTDMNKRAMPEYKMKKLDYVVYIDARPYKKIPNINSINCSVHILEPKRYDLLSGPTEFHGREIHLYPLFDPWIVISVLWSA